VDIPGNRLGKQGGDAVLDSLNEKVRYLNLANNNIGSESMFKLVNWIDFNCSHLILEELNLEGNQINDQVVISLVDAMVKTIAPFRKLVLSNNNITNTGAIAIADLVKVHYNMRILMLKKNKISTVGGVMLAYAIRDTPGIVVLDLSWNLMGQKRDQTFG
jgi:Ran GTPase-activating protein (RanGAP) involved in mRNA processing and transport